MRILKFLAVSTVLAALTLPTALAAGFELDSPEIAEGAVVPMGQVFDGAGCSGGNMSPALAWKDAPAGTRSFAVTVYDPDAPTGHGFYHWAVFDIPANVAALPENAGDPAANLMPQGAVQLRNGFGGYGYGGPCPPPGDPSHRYVFTVYALDVAALGGLDAGSPAARLDARLQSHILAAARLVAKYP